MLQKDMLKQNAKVVVFMTGMAITAILSAFLAVLTLLEHYQSMIQSVIILIIILAAFIITSLIFLKHQFETITKLEARINELANNVIEQEKKISLLSAEKKALMDTEALKTNLYTCISHEMKTPLSVILGAVQLIEKKGLADMTAIQYGTSSSHINGINSDNKNIIASSGNNKSHLSETTGLYSASEAQENNSGKSGSSEAYDYNSNEIVENQSNIESEQKWLKNNFNTIKVNGNRLLSLINNFLDFSKIEEGFIKLSTKTCNIVELVEEATMSIVTYAEQNGLHIVFDADQEEIIAAVDSEKIEKIILNLLSNSIKFTPSGGQISVFVSSRSDIISISVKDTGIGIPEDKLDRIFDKFRQADNAAQRNHSGSGLGLSISKSFAELHGGRINVKSRLNKGSEFTLELPLQPTIYLSATKTQACTAVNPS